MQFLAELASILYFLFFVVELKEFKILTPLPF